MGNKQKGLTDTVHRIPVIDMADVMKKPATAAVKKGQDHVEYYLYEALQIFAELNHHSMGGINRQDKLALLGILIEPLLKPIEKHWRNKGRRLDASIIFHPLTGEPGILVLEPVTGNKRHIYGRKGEGYCIQQV
jgi:hypothetical protein